MRRMISVAGLVALHTLPAAASEITYPEISREPRAMAPAEFLVNYSVDLIGLRQAIGGGLTGIGAVIAVIDDGFDLDHPYFEGRLIEAINTGGAGGPGEVRIHGTHVAGIASSVAPGAMLGFYTFDETGENVGSNAAAFLAGAQRGAVVYNNSWGYDIDVNSVLNDPNFDTDRFLALEEAVGVGSADGWRTFIDAMLDAQETGVIVFAGSNDSDLPDIDVSAGLPLIVPELREAWIAVVNVDEDGDIISVSCGSAAAFCLAGPGADIISTGLDGEFVPLTGTSMAAPHVSGAIALASEIFPDATPSQLSQLIFQTAADIGEPGIDSVYGWGMLNVGNIVSTVDPLTAETFANASWSRFSALGQVGSVMRQRLAFASPSAFGSPSAAMQSSNTPVTLSSSGNAVRSGNPSAANVWAIPLNGQATIKATPGSRGARNTTTGLIFGADLVKDRFATIGVAGGFSYTRLKTSGTADSGRSNAVHLGLYGSIKSDNWFIHGSGQVAFFDQSITRSAISGAQGTSNTFVGLSSFRGTAFEADARVGYSFDLIKRGKVSPYAAFNARYQVASSFQETGAGIFGVSGSSGSQRQFDFGPGLHWASSPIPIQIGTLHIETEIAYARLVGDRRNTTSVLLLGRGIEGNTAEIGRDVLRVSGRLNIVGNQDKVSGFVGYGGSFQKGAESHNVSAGLNIAF